jgi:hypothetical protein
MTDTVQVALIVTIGPTIIGALNLLHQIIVARKVSEVGDHLKAETKEIKAATNGMKDALVAATAKASHAEGVQDEKNRAAEVAISKLENGKQI